MSELCSLRSRDVELLYRVTRANVHFPCEALEVGFYFLLLSFLGQKLDVLNVLVNSVELP
jgi:hypothetical protein